MPGQPKGTRRRHEEPGYTHNGEAFSQLVAEVFRLHGCLIAAGNALTKRSGTTAARWQVIETIARREQPPTVARVARALGLSRQSVQRAVEELEREGVVRRRSAPNHRRALPIQLTARGEELYDEVRRRQVPWANHIAERIAASRLDDVVEILRALRSRLETPSGWRPRTRVVGSVS